MTIVQRKKKKVGLGGHCPKVLSKEKIKKSLAARYILKIFACGALYKEKVILFCNYKEKIILFSNYKETFFCVNL